MKDPIKVLLVEDRPEDADLLVREMRARGLRVSSLRVDSAATYARALDEFSPDLILSDYTLPGFHGVDALETALRCRPDTPFIFVSGTIGEERAIQALKQGAVDYVLKDNRARLVPAIERALRDVDERQARRAALHELEQSEQRFRSIAEATQEWIWEIDASGVFTFCSSAVRGILGYPPERLIGTNCLDIVSASSKPAMVALLREGIQRKRGWRDLVLHLRDASGGEHWLDNDALPLFASDGSVIGYRGVARDITQRRLQQDRIERLSRIQAVLSGINSAIVRVRGRQELFREVCRIAVAQGGFKLAWIGTVESGARKVLPLVAEGGDAHFLERLTELLGVREDHPGPIGEALRDKRIMFRNDIENGADELARAARAAGFRSMLAAPLVVGDETVAVLALYSADSGFFDQEELKLLNDLQADISFALDYIDKEEQLTYVSYYDTLTGLANRQLFFDRLGQALQSAQSQGRGLAVVLIDLERFMRINDTLGRSAGDHVLKQIAVRLQHSIRDEGIAARVGGDRFAVLVPGLLGAELARWVDEHIVAVFAAPVLVESMEIGTAAKIGVALFPADANQADTLFANAEAALQRAKRSPDKFLFYSAEINAQLARRQDLRTRLRRAAAEQEFCLLYQVKVDLKTRRVQGVEALLRWQDAENGEVAPKEFVPVLEESGLIVDVGRWVFQQAALDAHFWRARGLRVPRIAVNVSEVQLRQPHFVQDVIATLQADHEHLTGVDVEITESMLAQNTASNVQKLLQLREAGICVFMDDFGTGYSGLSQIAHLPLDALKIDRSFIAGMAGSAEHLAIVSAVINLAKALGIHVVAEGVEVESQAEQLRDLGCDAAQGFLFGPPLTREGMAALLAKMH